MKPIVDDAVVEEIVKEGYDYAGQKEVIFTFPKSWSDDQCDKYVFDRCFNTFIYSTTEDGANRYTCAYSWRLSYQKQFGEYPTDC